MNTTIPKPLIHQYWANLTKSAAKTAVTRNKVFDTTFRPHTGDSTWKQFKTAAAHYTLQYKNILHISHNIKITHMIKTLKSLKNLKFYKISSLITSLIRPVVEWFPPKIFRSRRNVSRGYSSPPYISPKAANNF